jgi:DNA polymerase-3 subunit delta
MKLRSEQLDQHLQKRPAPVYMIFGDEPLLVQEACDAVRGAARRDGYDERIVMDADAGFDWEALRHSADNLSLFTRRRLLELRLLSGKPGQAGAKVLADYAARPPEDTLLLISSGRLDKGTYTAQWFKAVEQHGVTVQVWPVPLDRLSGWIAARMRAKGMQADPAAAALIAAYTEGNLLAAVQEIEKLHLLYGGERIDAQRAAAAVTESARFTIYDLGDAALAGDTARVVRVVDALRAEGTAPPLVLWALVQELRGCYAMAWELARGANIDQVLGAQRVKQGKRQALARQALRRHPAARWRGLLHRAAHVERVIKGQRAGSVWDELLQLGTAVAGAESATPTADPSFSAVIR